jgi:hypothetical protein
MEEEEEEMAVVEEELAVAVMASLVNIAVVTKPCCTDTR